MTEIGPLHTLDYRSDVLGPLFAAVRARDSCTIVGASSMGKSRMVEFLLRADVQHVYSADDPAPPIIVRVDGNRLAERSDFGLYELLLDALVHTAAFMPAAESLRAELYAARERAILSRNSLLTLRTLELALPQLIHALERPIVLLCDEFDQIYRETSPLALANLRALRDHNKYQLAYVMLLREHPQHLRDPNECEGFFELITRSVIGLGPFRPRDAERMLDQIVARRRLGLSAADRAAVIALSGGHPGLIGVLADLAAAGALADAADDPAVREECRKILAGLSDEQQEALRRSAQGRAADAAAVAALKLKGLLRADGGGHAPFSPLAAAYVAEAPPDSARTGLHINHDTRSVTVDGRHIELTALQFALLAYLAAAPNRVHRHAEIIAAVWPTDHDPDVDRSRLEALVSVVRRQIEPEPQRPRYLITRWGVGYLLQEA